MSSLIISTIQTSLIWEDKAGNMQSLENKIRSLKGDSEMVILPEMFTTGFSMNASGLAEKMDGHTVSWMKKLSAENNLIITGSLIIEEEGKFFNRMIWMMPNGSYGTYDKRHLFAYSGEDVHYTAGTKRLITSVKGWKINLQVCYDLRFPVWSRQAASAEQAEYDILVYVANWPDKRINAWKALITARAIENQCYVIGVNRVGTDANGHVYSGSSMIADPMGEILYQKMDAEDIFTIKLEKKELQAVRDKLPFLRDRDTFSIGV